MCKYNYLEIGNRIRAERKKMGLSQAELLDNIKDKGKPTCIRNILSQLENGEETAFNGISMEKMIALCEEFDCSLSYLLGEYSCKNYDTEFIHQMTGLSEESIKLLINWIADSDGSDIRCIRAKNSTYILDNLIKRDFWFSEHVLCQIADYCYYRNSYDTYEKEDKDKPLTDIERLFTNDIKDRPYSKKDRKNLAELRKNYELALFNATRGLTGCIEDIYKINYLDK